MTYSRMLAVGALALVIGGFSQRPVARADAPQYLPVQGYLQDADDKPVKASLAMRFRLYSSSTASEGAVLYEEIKPAVNVDQGYFTAYLGEKETLELSLFRDHPVVFVGIRVAADRAAVLQESHVGPLRRRGLFVAVARAHAGTPSLRNSSRNTG